MNKKELSECVNCKRYRDLLLFDKRNRKDYLRNKRLKESGYCVFVADCPIIKEKKINVQLQIIF